jgi:hypothetical protein
LEAEFPVEKAKTKEILTLVNKVKISELLSYPVRGLIFEVEASLDDLCDVISLSTVSLQEENTPFNVLISASGKRIFLLLQVLVYSSPHNASFLTFFLFFYYLFNFFLGIRNLSWYKTVFGPIRSLEARKWCRVVRMPNHSV